MKSCGGCKHWDNTTSYSDTLPDEIHGRCDKMEKHVQASMDEIDFTGKQHECIFFTEKDFSCVDFEQKVGDVSEKDLQDWNESLRGIQKAMDGLNDTSMISFSSCVDSITIKINQLRNNILFKIKD